MMTLLQQPVEIIDTIVWHVVDRQDLLSLGLTAKALGCIVFPRHIQYHTVSASLRNIDTWQHLIRNRACARNVRRLEVMRDAPDDTSSFGPNRFQLDRLLDNVDSHGSHSNITSGELPEIDLDRSSEGLLVIAVQGMPNLRTFIWHRSCPPVLSGGLDIWAVLRNKKFLVEVILNESRLCAPAYALREAQQNGVWSILTCPISETFFGLTRFELECRPLELDGATNIIPSILELLVSQCPSLESLRFAICLSSPPTLDHLFIRGRWPSLNRLNLKWVNLSPTRTMSRALATFLSSHSKLAHLTWHWYAETYEELPTVLLHPNSLPNLLTLDADNWTVRDILSCPCSPPRKLERLCGLELETEFWGLAPYHLQGVDRTSLRAVKLSDIHGPVDLQRLAISFPNIEHLDLQDIDLKAEVWDQETASTRVLLTAEWAEKLGAFRNLRVLSGIFFVNSENQALEEQNAEVVTALGVLFPRLERLDDGSHLSRMIEIVRGVDGTTWRTVPKIVFP